MPDALDFKEYIDLVAGNGGYRDIEIEMLKEALESFRRNAGNPFTILEIRDGRMLAAIAVGCRVPSREFTMEIRYLCIGRDYESSRAGEHILSMIDDAFLRMHEQVLIQIESSTGKLSRPGLSLLENSGYNLIGHIPDFYASGDDFYMFSKFLSRVREKPESSGAGIGSASRAAGGKEDAKV
jgi:hypothetical protein